MLYIFDMGGVVTNDANPRPRICSVLGLSEADYLRYCGRGGRKEDDLLLVESWTNPSFQQAHCQTQRFQKLQEIKARFCERVEIEKVNW